MKHLRITLTVLTALALTAALSGCATPPLDHAAGALPPAQSQPPSDSETGTETVSGVVEDAVSYTIDLPSVQLDSADAAQVIGDYYDLQSAKLMSLAQTEVYDAVTAAQTPTVGDVTAAVDSRYETDRLLSVQRSVTVTVGEETQTTYYAETFSKVNGGLYTLADLGLTADSLTPLLRSRLAERDALQPGWEDAVATGFEPTQFALTAEGLTIFYQAGVLSPAAVFEVIPYDQLPEGFALPD